MKNLLVLLVWLGACSLSMAGAPSAALVDEYLKASRAEEAVAAQLDGYRTQMLADAPPQVKRRISEYLEATLGWSAIRVEYAELVRKTYTAEELKAAMAFMKSPAGASINQKSKTFARELATVMAKRSQTVAQQSAEAFNSADESVAARESSTDLQVRDAVRHENDGRVYFTGALENKGKRVARGVQVEVNLFRGDQFVDQYTTYISGAIPPGTTRLFKVSCGCKDSPPAKHDSYKVQVVNGGY